MLRKQFQDLARHMEWADAEVWNAALRLPEATSDASLLERLHHLHTVQWAYLQIWRGEPVELPELPTFEGAVALRDWAREYHRQVAAHLARIDAEALGRPVTLPWADQVVERYGDPEPASLAETILQVVYHTTYHRGQINTRLRELEAEPPLTDYIAWIWMGRPDPDWNARSTAP